MLEKKSFLSLKVYKDNIFHLENFNKNRDCLGKKIFNPKRYKKDSILHLHNI